MSLANDSSPLSPPRERIPRRPTQGCQRCSMKKSRRKKSNNMRSARPRVFCDIAGCASSFCRFSDLARHKKTLHGPKQQCAYHGCQYATGREDKMNEHVRKIHKSADSQDGTSLNNLPSSDNFYHTQALHEFDKVGYEGKIDQSMLLTGGVDGMAQSLDIMNFAGDFDANFDVFGPFLANDPAPPNFYN